MCCFIFPCVPFSTPQDFQPLESPPLSCHSQQLPWPHPHQVKPNSFLLHARGFPDWFWSAACSKWGEARGAGPAPAACPTLPEGVGEGYVDAEVTLGLVRTVHTEAQLSRVPAACCKCKDCKKLSKTNNIFILFRFSDHHEQIHAVALAAAPAPLGHVIHHSLHLKHLKQTIHYSCTLPKSKEPWHMKFCCHTDRHITICPSSSLLSWTPFGICNPSSCLNRPIDRWDWILTEHNE